MLFDYKQFRQKYKDPTLEFFNELLPQTKDLFHKSLPLLEKAYIENDKKEWKNLKKALRILGKCMFIPGLYKIGNCTLEEYNRIEEILTSILEEGNL